PQLGRLCSRRLYALEPEGLRVDRRCHPPLPAGARLLERQVARRLHQARCRLAQLPREAEASPRLPPCARDEAETVAICDHCRHLDGAPGPCQNAATRETSARGQRLGRPVAPSRRSGPKSSAGTAALDELPQIVSRRHAGRPRHPPGGRPRPRATRALLAGRRKGARRVNRKNGSARTVLGAPPAPALLSASVLELGGES
ncbi:Hypothetical protein EMIHUDRAFT_460077, partial [Emiliania huxleyi CCMP1516]|uniref:Uncharacterized protein n=2 Tax=Emiliania huxleyi TaxID=2903 RepID=A0A0D3I632_EMIH1